MTDTHQRNPLLHQDWRVRTGPTMADWSSVRRKSAKELKKNPNAFFYRHVAPHEEQVSINASADHAE